MCVESLPALELGKGEVETGRSEVLPHKGWGSGNSYKHLSCAHHDSVNQQPPHSDWVMLAWADLDVVCVHV